VKTPLACIAMLCASAGVSVAGCAHTSAFAKNEVCDSELRAVDRCWTIGNAFTVRPGLGPDGASILYYAGTGRPSGFDTSATFLAIVKPGGTYTFSAYVDGADHLDVPPYVILSAVNGTWRGAFAYQADKGRIASVFTIPPGSRTTLVRGAFATENGTYPRGRGAIFSQPQLEQGDQLHPYTPSDDQAWTGGPPTGNLVIGSEAAHSPQYWTFNGSMSAIKAGPRSYDAVTYRGDGARSGFDQFAAFVARVRAGSTYTFSAYVDGSAHAGTPPYIFLEPVNGDWSGAHITQPNRGELFTTFTIPADSATTMVRATFSTENGAYSAHASALLAEPQLERGDFPHRYEPGRDTILRDPPGGNLIADSEQMRRPAWTTAGAMQRIRWSYSPGAAAIVYKGDGMPSGFNVTASTRARVRPGSTYTLSAYVDGSAHRGTPPYVWVLPANGTWSGAHTYQSGRGLTMLTFTVPPSSGTTCVNVEFSTQNGTYPRGAALIVARAELAAGSELFRYVPGAVAAHCK
jgi:hypothetical protein